MRMKITKQNKTRLILSSIIICIGILLFFIPGKKVDEPVTEGSLLLTSDSINLPSFGFRSRSFDHELNISISEINNSVRIIILNASELSNYQNGLNFTPYFDEIVANPLFKSIPLYPLDTTSSYESIISIIVVRLDTDAELTLLITCSYRYFHDNYGILFLAIGVVFLAITIKQIKQSDQRRLAYLQQE